jgi:hypothetical protein
MNSEPRSGPPVEPAEPAALVDALRPLSSMTWVIVVAVGVPLLLVLAAGLEAIDANSTATGFGASILAALVAGRAAGIRGASRWFVAWLVIFGIAGVLGLLLLPWDMPG